MDELVFSFTVKTDLEPDQFYKKTRRWLDDRYKPIWYKVSSELPPNFISIEYGGDFVGLKHSEPWQTYQLKFQSVVEKTVRVEVLQNDANMGIKPVYPVKLELEGWCRYLGVDIDDDLLKALYSLEDMRLIVHKGLIELMTILITTYGFLVLFALLANWDRIFLLKVVLATLPLALLACELGKNPIRNYFLFKKRIQLITH